MTRPPTANDTPGEQAEARRGPLLRWLRGGPAVADDDTYVRQWKQSWAGGANARWQGAAASDNPHRGDSLDATAWKAGWSFADQQPDRRTSLVRFAVPQRRASDHVSTLRRSARAGAVGLSVLAVAGWLWQTRRRK